MPLLFMPCVCGKKLDKIRREKGKTFIFRPPSVFAVMQASARGTHLHLFAHGHRTTLYTTLLEVEVTELLRSL